MECLWYYGVQMLRSDLQVDRYVLGGGILDVGGGSTLFLPLSVRGFPSLLCSCQIDDDYALGTVSEIWSLA